MKLLFIHILYIILFLFITVFFFFFFFSSRRRHTRFDCDWSSDVCSSDLMGKIGVGKTTLLKEAKATFRCPAFVELVNGSQLDDYIHGRISASAFQMAMRSEERRVGKECRSRWSPYH